MMQIYRERLGQEQLSPDQRQQLQRQYAAGHFARLDYDMRQRSRFRAQLQDGQPFGIDLPRTAALRDGDVVLAEDGALLQIFAADQDLLAVTAASDFELMRGAYHLGNRHVPLMLSQHAGRATLYLEPDSVLADMLQQLGLQVEPVQQPFEPESGAYASHRHEQPLQPHDTPTGARPIVALMPLDAEN